MREEPLLENKANIAHKRAKIGDICGIAAIYVILHRKLMNFHMDSLNLNT
jgi:hypothetical protein